MMMVASSPATSSRCGPFSADPGGSSSGILSFDERVFGLFVVGLQGGLPSNPNYSYYLFDTETTGTLFLKFDTNGVVRSDGSAGGGPLAFATLYLLRGAAVPEPAGIALAAMAFGALALTTRRRRG